MTTFKSDVRPLTINKQWGNVWHTRDCLTKTNEKLLPRVYAQLLQTPITWNYYNIERKKAFAIVVAAISFTAVVLGSIIPFSPWTLKPKKKTKTKQNKIKLKPENQNKTNNDATVNDSLLQTHNHSTKSGCGCLQLSIDAARINKETI